MFGKSPRSSRAEPSVPVSPRTSGREISVSPRKPTITGGGSDESRDPSPRSVSPRGILQLQRIKNSISESPPLKESLSSSSPSPPPPPPLPKDLPKDVALRSWFVRAIQLRNAPSKSQRRSLGDVDLMTDEMGARSSEGDECFEFSSESVEVAAIDGIAPQQKNFAAFLLPVMRISHSNLFGGSVEAFEKFLQIVFGAENVVYYEEHWIVGRGLFNLVLACSVKEVILLLAMDDVSLYSSTVKSETAQEIRRACNLVELGKQMEMK